MHAYFFRFFACGFPRRLFIERLIVMSVSRVFPIVLCSAVFSFVLMGQGVISVFAQDEPSAAELSSSQIEAGEEDLFLEQGEAQKKSDVIDNDAFFDAEDMVPRGEMARHGPNKIDPNKQPASKIVLVRKNHEPDSKEANLVAAERAMKLGRFDSSLDLFDALYEKNKKDSRILMGRAVVLQKLGRFDEAMGMYEELSKVEPDNVEVKVNMLGLLSTRFPSIALRRLLNLREENMSNIGLASQIAVCYAALGDFQEALRYMGSAASMEPNNANHLYNMAIVADRSGDKKQAVSYYEKALEIDSVHGGGRTIPRESVYERLAQIR
jgi:tetratricopeptide (TPR) repeat protein